MPYPERLKVPHDNDSDDDGFAYLYRIEKSIL